MPNSLLDLSLDEFGRIELPDDLLEAVLMTEDGASGGGTNTFVCGGTTNSTCTNANCTGSHNGSCSNTLFCGETQNARCPRQNEVPGD